MEASHRASTIHLHTHLAVSGERQLEDRHPTIRTDGRRCAQREAKRESERARAGCRGKERPKKSQVR